MKNNLFLNTLSKKILLFDGATGTALQTQNLNASDFGGPELEGCNRYLCISNPDAVRKVHNEYLSAGADIIETNSFGSASIVLSEYNIEDKAYQLSKLSATIAKECTSKYSTPEWL